MAKKKLLGEIKTTTLPICIEGEALIATYEPKSYQFILSPAIQTCLAVVLYNAQKKSGAILHFPEDEGFQTIFKTILNQDEFKQFPNQIAVTLVGGVDGWLSCYQQTIGKKIQKHLANLNIENCTYNHFSYSVFYCETYNVKLNLENGEVRVDNSKTTGMKWCGLFSTSTEKERIKTAMKAINERNTLDFEKGKPFAGIHSIYRLK